MRLTRFRVFLMLVLAVTSSSLLVWHFTAAIPAPSVGCTIEPGAGCGPAPCTFNFYIDGSTYLAAKCLGGGNAYSGTDFKTVMTSVLADSSCSSANGCSMFFHTGTYNLASTVTISNNNIFMDCESSGISINISGQSVPSPAVVFQPTNGLATDGDMFKFTNPTNTIQGLRVFNCDFNGQRPDTNPVVALHIQDVVGMWIENNVFSGTYDPGIFIDGAGLSGTLQNAGAGAFYISYNIAFAPLLYLDNNILTSDLFINHNWDAFSRGSILINGEAADVAIIIDGNKCENVVGMATRVGTLGPGGSRPAYCVDLKSGSASAGFIVAQLTNNVADHCNVTPCYNIGITQVIATNNFNFNPFGLISNPFSATSIGFPNGTAAAPTASTTYTVWGVNISNFTSTGGTGVVLTIKDRQGNCLVCGASSITNMHLDVTDTVSFGAFSVAPTVKVYGG